MQVSWPLPIHFPPYFAASLRLLSEVKCSDRKITRSSEAVEHDLKKQLLQTEQQYRLGTHIRVGVGGGVGGRAVQGPLGIRDQKSQRRILDSCVLFSNSVFSSDIDGGRCLDICRAGALSGGCYGWWWGKERKSIMKNVLEGIHRSQIESTS